MMTARNGKIVRAALTGTALLVAACAAPLTVHYYDNNYTPGEQRVAGMERTTVIRGNPFAIPQGEFDQSVVDAMQGWAASHDHFVLTGNPNDAYRVVVVFNPPPATGPNLCTRPLAVDTVFGQAPGAASAPVMATFCRGDRALATTYGSVEASAGPQSEAFRRGIGRFVAELFPLQNPDRTSDRCIGPHC
jgi:hypothetical protein